MLVREFKSFLVSQSRSFARKLYKETGSNAETVDVMFIDAVEGRDYTRLIKQGMTYTDEQAKGVWNANVNVAARGIDPNTIDISPTVEAFYETLLGPSFKLRENQEAFLRAVNDLGLDSTNIFTNQNITNVMAQMQVLYRQCRHLVV